MGSRTTFLWALLVSSTACTSTPPGPRALPLEIGADHFVGTIHTGPNSLAAAAESPAGDPWWIEVRIAYVQSAPASGGELLSTRTRQVFVERGGQPLKARSDLARGVICTSIDAEPARELRAERRTDPLWPGTTTLWRLRRMPEADEPVAPPWDGIEIELSRPPDEPERTELALVLEGQVVPRPESEEGESQSSSRHAGRPALEREHLVLASDPVAGGEPFRLFLPAPKLEFPSGGFEIELARAAPLEGDELAAALERGRSALALSLARAREGSSRLTTEEGFHFESGTALPALADPVLRRGALAFLAQVSGASLAGDLAIGLEPGELASFATSLGDRLHGQGTEAAPLPSLGWILESSAYAWLVARALDEKHPLAPELRALMLIHAGELGRFPDLLRDAVLDSDGLQSLARRLVDENRIFLEDADPAARLRAFEWLRDRGASPEAFDPLAPLAERRAALDRARDSGAAAGAAAPASGGGR